MEDIPAASQMSSHFSLRLPSKFVFATIKSYGGVIKSSSQLTHLKKDIRHREFAPLHGATNNISATHFFEFA